MKKIFNYKLLTVFTVLLFSSISCTKDFDEINTNNNAPTSAQAAPEMLLTNCIEVMTDRVHEIFLGEEMGSCWVQHQAKVQYTDEDRYRPRISVINNTWSSFYASSGMDAEAIIKIAQTRGAAYDNYQAAGIVLKCYIMSVLTDLFGDVPYTEAFKARPADGGILTPVYDTQEDIYLDIIRQLGVANSLFSTSTSVNPLEGDILYGSFKTSSAAYGNISYWKRFANSLRLRLLLRMSGQNAQMATDTMTNMLVTNAADYPIFTSNTQNAALTYLGSSPNNNPVNENRKTRDDHRISATLVEYMYGASNAFVDWRITCYANLAAASGDFVGLPNGLESAVAAAYLGNGLAQTSKLGDYFTAATAPGMLMSYAELNFILAEAVQKNYVTGSAYTAQEYFEEGIIASYAQYGSVIAAKVPALWGATNCTNWFGTATPTITDLSNHYLANQGAWLINGAGTELAQIGYERWLATFDQGLQSWFEWRRTGFPTLIPAAGAYNAHIPQRVYYPSDEYSRNSVNVAAAADAQGMVGQSDLDTRVWWDVADNF